MNDMTDRQTPAPLTALVLPAAGGAGYAPQAAGPKLLGFTPLERTIFSLAQAGVSRVLFLGAVPAGLADSFTARRVSGCAGLVLDVFRASDGPTGGERVLVAGEAVVFDPRLPLEALAKAPPDAPVVSVIGRDGLWVGLGWIAVALLPRLAAGETFAHLAAAVPAAVVGPAGRYAVLARSATGRRDARRALLRSVRKDTDGFVSRVFNRPVSQQLTRLFITVGATPNLISVIGLLIGLVAAALSLRGTYGALVAGAALFQLASILDGSDGEVAKLTGRASAFGSWVDTICDEVASLAYFVALPIGIYRGSGQAIYLALGAFSLVALGLLYVVMIAYLRRTASHGSMLQILADVHAASRLPGFYGALNRFMVGLSFTVRRDFFSLTVLLLCLAGLGAAAVWSLATILVFTMAFLIWFTAVAPTRPTSG